MPHLTAAAVALAAGFALGYAARIVRPYWTVIEWAEEQTRARPVRFWLAQPILAAAIGWQFATRPRQTIANVRSWREAEAAARAQEPVVVRNLSGSDR
jgi:hypothetical protein